MAVGATCARSRSTARAERYDCTKSIPALRSTIDTTMVAFTLWPSMAEATAQTRRMPRSGFEALDTSCRSTVARVCTATSFGPSRASSSSASAVLRPAAPGSAMLL